jgi:hypothetical protein
MPGGVQYPGDVPRVSRARFPMARKKSRRADHVFNSLVRVDNWLNRTAAEPEDYLDPEER